MFTMWPGSRSERWSTSRVIRTSPFTFVSNTVRSSSSLEEVNGSRPSASPAALTRMSAGPAASTNRSQLAASVTSSASATSVSSRSTRRAPPTTRAPSAASMRAVAAPIPLEAPVTIATLLSRRPMAGDVTRPAVPGPLLRDCDRERNAALRLLAVLVVHGRVQDVALPLHRREPRQERDGLVGRDPARRLGDGDQLLAVVDAVDDADPRPDRVAVGEERDVEPDGRLLPGRDQLRLAVDALRGGRECVVRGLLRAALRDQPAVPRLVARVAEDEPDEHLDVLVLRSQVEHGLRVGGLLGVRDAACVRRPRLLAVLGDPDRHAVVEPLLERLAELGEAVHRHVRVRRARVRPEARERRVRMRRPGVERQ